jgi:hypothetical protein
VIVRTPTNGARKGIVEFLHVCMILLESIILFTGVQIFLGHGIGLTARGTTLTSMAVVLVFIVLSWTRTDPKTGLGATLDSADWRLAENSFAYSVYASLVVRSPLGRWSCVVARRAHRRNPSRGKCHNGSKYGHHL